MTFYRIYINQGEGSYHGLYCEPCKRVMESTADHPEFVSCNPEDGCLYECGKCGCDYRDLLKQAA